MEKYVKIVYQSNPIGKEKIILYLTTFDKEAFEKDQLLEKKQAISFDIERMDFGNINSIINLENKLNDFVKKYYEPKVNELQGLINSKKAIRESIPLVNAKNISNVDEVHCGTVNGSIVNSDIVYCTEIKGNVINCDKIIYK